MDSQSDNGEKRSGGRLFVVTGMHRSGTSALTRGLEVLGVPLGSNLHPAGFHNPKGFWEDREVLAVNERLLALHGAAYDSVGLIDHVDLLDPKVASLRREAIDLIHRKLHEGDGRWGFKDPRLARLLKFWKTLFQEAGVDVTYILAIRNPRSVAQSLAVRNQFDPEKSHLLWIAHLVQGTLDTCGCNRVFVDYDNLLRDTGRELSRIAYVAELEVDMEKLACYRDCFLDPSLRHAAYRDIEFMASLPLTQLVREAYAMATHWASTAKLHEPDVRSGAQKWLDQLRRLQPALMRADGPYERVGRPT